MEKEFIVVLELGFWAFNIKKKVCGVLDFFSIFLRKCEKKKVHNMCWILISITYV
jgi:hypothetical protein